MRRAIGAIWGGGGWARAAARNARPLRRPPSPAALLLTVCLAGMLASGMAGCASLPSSGPTAHDIAEDQRTRNPLGFRIVDIDADGLELANSATTPTPGLATLAEPGVVDAIGPGDELQITVFEVGASLFANAANSPSSAASSGAPPTAAGENFPLVTVARDGTINLPYVGRVAVAGRTPSEVESLITEGLRGKSQSPQVIVTVHESVWNGALVMGEVKKPARLPLTPARERLLDAVAAGQGLNFPVQDLVVRVSRHGVSREERLDEIASGAPDDLVLLPQDRVEVIYRPRSYIIFGATKVAETQFQTPRVSLAEAIARAGGPLDQQADPSAIYVFRYEPETADGQAAADAHPIAYRLNMMQTEGFFLSSRFEMRPRDVVYVANARVNQISKLLQILNLFFSPVYTAKVVAQ